MSSEETFSQEVTQPVHETGQGAQYSEQNSRVKTWVGRGLATIALTASSFAASSESQADAVPEETQRGSEPIELANSREEVNFPHAESQAEIQQSEQAPEFLEHSIGNGCNEEGQRILNVTVKLDRSAHLDIMRDDGDNEPDQEDRLVVNNSASGNITYNREVRWSGVPNLPQESGEEATLYHRANSDPDEGFDNEDLTTYSDFVTVTTPSCSNSENGGGSEEPPEEPPDDGGGDVGGPHAIRTEQHVGPTPAHTAVEVSREEFSDGEAGMAVLATDETYADALAGGPLAEQVGGPILYADAEGLPDVTAEELQRLGTREVLLLGGEDALSRNVGDRLRNMGVNVTRIAGATRFETAAEIEGYMDTHTLATTHEVFLANGTTFADANAAAGLAAQQEGDREAAILLTTAEELHETTRRRLQERRAEVDRVTAVGGVAVIRSGVLRVSGDAASAETDRAAGDNRYETSAEVAGRDLRLHGNETTDGQPSIYVAPASSFHGALAAAPIEARQTNAALALVPESDERLLTAFERVIQDYKHTSWTDARIVGNLSANVRRTIDQEILDATQPVNE